VVACHRQERQRRRRSSSMALGERIMIPVIIISLVMVAMTVVIVTIKKRKRLVKEQDYDLSKSEIRYHKVADMNGYRGSYHPHIVYKTYNPVFSIDNEDKRRCKSISCTHKKVKGYRNIKLRKDIDLKDKKKQYIVCKTYDDPITSYTKRKKSLSLKRTDYKCVNTAIKKTEKLGERNERKIK